MTWRTPPRNTSSECVPKSAMGNITLSAPAESLLENVPSQNVPKSTPAQSELSSAAGMPSRVSPQTPPVDELVAGGERERVVHADERVEASVERSEQERVEEHVE